MYGNLFCLVFSTFLAKVVTKRAASVCVFLRITTIKHADYLCHVIFVRVSRTVAFKKATHIYKILLHWLLQH